MARCCYAAGTTKHLRPQAGTRIWKSMNSRTRNISTLALAGKQLHESPLSGQERACLLVAADGAERLGMFQLVSTRQHGNLHKGAEFFRVSFKLVGGEGEPGTEYSLAQDTVWAIVDHREAAIVFGPEDGMDIRHRDQGIGSYLLGQLVRQLQSVELRGNYAIQSVTLPVAAQLNGTDNDRRIERMVTRAGFYYSSASGTPTIGARKISDLKSWWNQERVQFLAFPRFVEMASEWHRGKLAAEKTAGAAQSAAEAAGREVQQLRTELREQAAQYAGELQASVDREEVLCREASEREARIQELNQLNVVLSEKTEFLHQQLEDAGSKVPRASGAASDQILTISLSRPVLCLLWAALAVATAGVIAHLPGIL